MPNIIPSPALPVPLPTAPSPREEARPEQGVVSATITTENKTPEQSTDQAQTIQRPVADFEPTNDGILFLGINPSAGPESGSLKKAVGANKITIIQDTPDGVIDGHDLKTKAGVTAFTESLKLPPEAQQKLAQVLTQITPQMRDEFAQIAKLWAKGENGEKVPSRLVLSGHSDGKKIFSGSGRGDYELDTLKSMAKIMPRAAAQIEDVHISGCNSGFKFNAERFQDAFPNLKTFWAYTGTAPSTGTNSEGHLQRWEKATRGHTDALERDQVSQGLGLRAESVSLWSAENGYQANPESLNNSHSDEAMYEQTNAYLNGDLPLPSTPSSGPVFELYEQLQRRQGGLSENASERKDIESMTGRALKLRFYDTVSENFQKVFEPNIKEIYESVGMDPPDFSKLNRKEAFESVKSLQAATGKLSETEAKAQEKNQLLLKGFLDLSPAIMGSEWIEPFNSDQIQFEREQAPDKLTSDNINSQRLQSPSPLGNLLEMLRTNFENSQPHAASEAAAEATATEREGMLQPSLESPMQPIPQPAHPTE